MVAGPKKRPSTRVHLSESRQVPDHQCDNAHEQSHNEDRADHDLVHFIAHEVNANPPHEKLGCTSHMEPRGGGGWQR